MDELVETMLKLHKDRQVLFSLHDMKCRPVWSASRDMGTRCSSPLDPLGWYSLLAVRS